MTGSSSPLRHASDTSPARWIRRRLGAFGSGVGGLLPHGLESYARILHPAEGRDHDPVRWADVAAWSGRSMHPRVQFAAIARPCVGGGFGLKPWNSEPRTGELAPDLLAALCETLAAHTQTSHCWYCLWEGYGWIHGGGVRLTAWPNDQRPPDSIYRQTPLAPAFARDIIDGPKVRLPNREYLLFGGPLEAAGELVPPTTTDGQDLFDGQSPNLFWPDDEAWCVATEIDLDSTYLGGSATLIADLLVDSRLEVVRADIRDSIHDDSDDINR